MLSTDCISFISKYMKAYMLSLFRTKVSHLNLSDFVFNPLSNGDALLNLFGQDGVIIHVSNLNWGQPDAPFIALTLGNWDAF